MYVHYLLTTSLISVTPLALHPCEPLLNDFLTYFVQSWIPWTYWCAYINESTSKTVSAIIFAIPDNPIRDRIAKNFDRYGDLRRPKQAPK